MRKSSNNNQFDGAMALQHPVPFSLVGWDLLMQKLPLSTCSRVMRWYSSFDNDRSRPRYYHCCQHPGGMYATLRQVAPDADCVELQLAIIYHDACIRLGAPRPFNEDNSARFMLAEFRDGMLALNYDAPRSRPIQQAQIKAAYHAILATADHFNAATALSRLLCDLDLSALACSRDLFLEVQKTVIAEMRLTLTWSAIWQARERFYTNLLSQPAIFRSGRMPSWWEDNARQNIEHDLATTRLRLLRQPTG